MKHMKFLTFFFCIAFAVFACSSNNETDPNAGGLPDKEEPLTTDFAKGADIGCAPNMNPKDTTSTMLKARSVNVRL